MYNNSMVVYAAYAKDQLLRLASSSGAVFSLLAEQILSNDGVVYGVTLSLDCKSAEFVRIDHADELFKLRGSKYLEAKVGDTYKHVREDLESGMNVLFSGVGCQINGLKAFLNGVYDNLICVDVICHGVPSSELWRRYTGYMEKQNGAELVSVNFRCKENSWQNFGMRELDKNRKELFIPKDKDSFMQMFLRNYCLRPSCYECNAKKVKMSEITIGDFWGIERIAPEMDDNKGTSLMIIRNEKGIELFRQISDKLVYKEVSYEEAVRGNSCEYMSVARPKERDTFFQDMNTLEFNILQQKYAAPIPDAFTQKANKKIKKVFLKICKWYYFIKDCLTDSNKFSGGGGRIKCNVDNGILYQFAKWD